MDVACRGVLFLGIPQGGVGNSYGIPGIPDFQGIPYGIPNEWYSR